MFSQDEFLKLMVDLKAVEAELKCALNGDCQRDKVEYATKRLHAVVQELDAKFWQIIERKR